MPIQSVVVYDDAKREFGRRTIQLNTDHVVTASTVAVKGVFTPDSTELTLITGAVLYMDKYEWEKIQQG